MGGLGPTGACIVVVNTNKRICVVFKDVGTHETPPWQKCAML
jgi:hypothetical protein